MTLRSSSSSSQLRRACNRGEKLLLLTSKTSNNPDRVFGRYCNWDRKNSCNYFHRDDEDITQEDAEECFYFPEHIAGEYRRKIDKLKKEVAGERARGNFLMVLPFISWVVTIGFCCAAAIKRNCNVWGL